METTVEIRRLPAAPGRARSSARRKDERRRIPADFPFDRVPGLSREVVQRLTQVRPTRSAMRCGSRASRRPRLRCSARSSAAPLRSQTRDVCSMFRSRLARRTCDRARNERRSRARAIARSTRSRRTFGLLDALEREDQPDRACRSIRRPTRLRSPADRAARRREQLPTIPPGSGSTSDPAAARRRFR